MGNDNSVKWFLKLANRGALRLSIWVTWNFLLNIATFNIFYIWKSEKNSVDGIKTLYYEIPELWILLDISVCKYMYMNYFALMDRDNELFILSFLISDRLRAFVTQTTKCLIRSVAIWWRFTTSCPPIMSRIRVFYPPEGDITGVILEFKHRKGCSV